MVPPRGTRRQGPTQQQLGLRLRAQLQSHTKPGIPLQYEQRLAALPRPQHHQTAAFVKIASPKLMHYHLHNPKRRGAAEEFRWYV